MTRHGAKHAQFLKGRPVEILDLSVNPRRHRALVFDHGRTLHAEIYGPAVVANSMKLSVIAFTWRGVQRAASRGCRR